MCIGYNLKNNYWETLFQQGLSMLGINNTFGSFGSFNPMSMNGSLFNYNINYDAMALYDVTNAVFGVTGQAIFSSRAEKQAEKQEYANNQTRLEQIDNDIKKQEEIKADKNSEISKQEEKIKNANAKLTTLRNAKTSLKLEDKEAAMTAAKNGTDAELIKKTTEAYNEAKKEADKLDAQIKEQESIIETANGKIASCNTDINNANTEIKKLKAEKEKLQKEVNSYEDSKVKTKLASSDEVYNAKIENIENKYDDKNDDGSFTKKDVYNAMGRFIKAADGSPEKLKVAKELYYAHNHCGNDFDAQTIRYAQRAFNYINEHKEEA